MMMFSRRPNGTTFFRPIIIRRNSEVGCWELSVSTFSYTGEPFQLRALTFTDAISVADSFIKSWEVYR